MSMPKLGACGDNCDLCPRFKATKSGKIEVLEKVKELWVKTGLRDNSISASELSCSGCTRNKYCGSKELLNCVINHGIQNCGYCKSYPCEIILKSINKTENWVLNIKGKCTEEEYEVLSKAFCMKKENLDKIKANTHSQAVK
jgi:hypothetical protein